LITRVNRERPANVLRSEARGQMKTLPPLRPRAHFNSSCNRRPVYSSEVILIVAGVAGCGKTTIGALLAGRLHWQFDDADTFHPPANVEKMRAGIPLTDEDRWPWLQAIGSWMDARVAEGQSAVLACSALKRSYRDVLLDGRPEVRMIFLLVNRVTLMHRLADRRGHFFPEKLLDSQLAAVELPQPDEHVLVVTEVGNAAQTAAKILALIWPNGLPSTAAQPGQSAQPGQPGQPAPGGS
jgi:gluconokinase